jgi:hypothetical protein
VRLVVGVDDVLPDPAAAAYFVAVGFGPGADLRNVIPAASAASAPAASPWRWRGLTLHAPAFLNEVFSADWWPTGFSVLMSAGQQPVGRVVA